MASNTSYARSGFPRQPAEARSQTRVRSILEAALPAGELSALRADGAAMSEEAAAQLALKRPTDST